MATENKIHPNLATRMYVLGKNIAFAKEASLKLRQYRLTQWMQNVRKDWPPNDNNVKSQLTLLEVDAESKCVTPETIQSQEIKLCDVLCKLLDQSLEELEQCKNLPRVSEI